MIRAYIVLSLCFLPALITAQVSYAPGTPVDVIHYEFNIALNDTTNAIEGKTVIDVNFNGPVSSFEFDLKKFNSTGKGMKIDALLFNGSDVRWEHSFNRIIITPDVAPGKGTSGEIIVIYSGIPEDGLIISKNKFGNRTFFADHWPDRASCYLPVVDHPSDKATVDFIITAPSHYDVVANGYLTEESDLTGNMKLTHWKEDVPLPVKVMTFGAAGFAVSLAGTVNNIPVWTWVFPENREEGFYDYSVAVKPLTFYNELIGPYPYEKLANVQSKTIFGGMENAGCIFYRENSVTGQGKAENLIAHEIAHQWFGNSVTERDWHHIWLSEGFATYLASVYDEKYYGKDKLTEDMKSARNMVIRPFERIPAPVIDTTITNLRRLLSTNSYQKGAWILHMLRSELGEDQFWAGMRLFYQRFRNGNALSDDFRKIMEEVSDKDLNKFFYQWLYVPGQPDLKISIESGKKKGTSDIIIEQKQDFVFFFNLEIGLKDSGGPRTITIPVSQKTTRTNVKADPGVEMVIDPDVKLLFRIIQN